MASITTRKNGSRFVSFVDAGGKPRTITLGKVAMRYAESIKVKVEDLVASSIHHHAPRDETARWLVRLDDRLYGKLTRVGLVQDRQCFTLKGWLEQYLKERADCLKPESLRKLKQTREKLLPFFDADVTLRSITAQRAVEWRQYLKAEGLSEAAIKTHCGNAKTIIGEAVRRKLIDESPFTLLKSGATASRHSRYVTPDEIERVMNACPDAEWKLLFGLARYAGLRIPSESHRLTWADVDFERGRLTVHSPKTEHHAGHEQRILPITPKLMRLLQDRFDECEDGEERLVAIGGKGGGMTRPATRIVRKASVEPWARLWQTLRQSCEKEWAMTFPQYAVSKWIGHSITVSGRHYANDVPDELFAKASAWTSESDAQRHAQQKAHEDARNARKSKRAAEEVGSPSSGAFKDFHESSASPGRQSEWSRGESNPRTGAAGRPHLRV